MKVEMHRITRQNDKVHEFMNELTSRIVAETGVPSDRYHLGKIILQSFKDAPDFISQIDGGTGESETNASVLERSVRCANAFRIMGLQRNDIMVLMAPNHIHLAIPYYAALYLGITIAPIDRSLTVPELKETFKILNPKIIFCQNDKVHDIQAAIHELRFDLQTVTFDEGNENLKNVQNFTKLLAKGRNVSVEEFKAEDFDPDETIAFLATTSGTTGLPKQAALSHTNIVSSAPYKWSIFTKFPTPTRMALQTSHLQWVSSIFQLNLSPVMRITRLQTSLVATPEHVFRLINTYKPSFAIVNPNYLITLIKSNQGQCDFSSFEMFLVGGSAVHDWLLDEIKKVTGAEAYSIYGASEMSSYFVFFREGSVPGSVGKRVGNFQYRLVDSNEVDILEPNVPGELWVKGLGVFKGYYKNPTATKEVFAEDGWLRSGDLFYRDENWNFYFVERIKSLLKYNSHQVSPAEVEEVIRKHPGVMDVVVTGVPDVQCGDLVVACVVRCPGHEVTAQDIKDLVKESLSDSKQLRGGVVFLNEIPYTASLKVHRRKLKEMVLQMERE